ncbi:preprotein translocase subunit SecD [Sphingomonas sp. Leaf357]|uniref:protein translocase subunit SecD n=1 Tax=Sphingomonas sp. Leaf357 TaxID=1736350 RepID=UPI0006F5C8DF|nr:protein translocase subunit SecD [Sphingomonas sp. Leaf357]KQS03503.1 preprotein translocase subunit SecD [Sphingomonas sp. Leaf357]
MLDFPRWKVLSILGLLGALMLLAVPSFLPQSMTDKWGSFPHSRVNLGLDLAGGSYLLLEADTSELARTRLDNMRNSIADAMKAAPAIQTGDIVNDGTKLSFLLRDVTQLDAARERLNKLTGGAGMTGQRDWDLSVVDASRIVMTPTKAGFDQAVKEAMSTTTDVVRTRIDKLGTREPTIIGQGTNRIVVQVPGLNDPTALKELLGKTAKLEFKMVDETRVDPTTNAIPVGSQLLNYTDGGPQGKILVKRRAILTGDQLVSASQGFKQEDNQPIVNFAFDSAGGKTFARVTQENIGKRFAVVVDNQVISAPRINTAILGGAGYIEGSFTVASANNLAISLSSGKLSVSLKVIEERTVGPDLGADSIHKGILASVIAVVAVIIFMLVTYGRFGVYANIAVVINVIIIVGVLAMLKGTLTLPGIAGFVLTIGTAVDANVLINERIREERRRGRKVVQAVELGYKEASRTIFEANVTHAISGVIMLLLGSGPVKGFAVVLLIGICTSVFTAVVFTRMMVALWLRKNRPTDINI